MVCFLQIKAFIWKPAVRDFFGGPVVKDPLSNAGDAVQSLIRELRSHMPQGN